jgi:hypothetical protein
VQKPGTDYLTVRARVKKHLEHLLKRHGAKGSKILKTEPAIAGMATDYPYRIILSHAEWAKILAFEAKSIEGNNFKGTVHNEGRHFYARLLMQIWTTMNGAEQKGCDRDAA